MPIAKEMLAEGLVVDVYPKYRAIFLYPWDLASLVWMKNSGSQSNQILSDIPVVHLYDFSHPSEIPEKDCPFAIDGERYYFTKQVRRDASGNRSQRKAGEQGAYWKSTSRDIDIEDLCEKLIGYMRKYALYEDKDCKRSANWYMEEYRVTDHELVDPYVLCKIYDKDSQCPKYTKTSIRALRKRSIERQLGSHLDQTNSLFDNKNQSKTQFDGSNSHEDIISTSHDASRNQNLPESIPSNPWNNNPMNQSPTQSDNNFVENYFLSDLIWPTSPADLYSNEHHYMDGISDGPSMPHYYFGNLNAVDGEE